jgi:hypothetical protein
LFSVNSFQTMAMAATKVCSAQGVLGVRDRMERVPNPENGRFMQKGPFLGKTVQS